jgi:hypothetical protein
MDTAERGAPPAPQKLAQTGAVSHGIGVQAAAWVGVFTAPRPALVPAFARVPATTVASMQAGSGAARDTPNPVPDPSEPIRPRPHEIPHIEPDPGWSLPRPAHLPHPTYWPAVLAMGTVFFAWGLVTNPVVTIVGVVVFFVALLGWIGDLRHDS